MAMLAWGQNTITEEFFSETSKGSLTMLQKRILGQASVKQSWNLYIDFKHELMERCLGKE